MADDLYTVLGVPKTADAAAIKKAYRALARDLHPDKNPGNDAIESRFKKVNQAFQTLSNPEKRALYDEFGDEALREGFDADRARQVRQWSQQGGRRGGGGGVNLEDLFGGGNGVHVNVGGQGVNASDIFEMFGGGGRRRQRVQRGQDAETHVTVSFADAARGTTLTMAPHGAPLTVRIPAGAEHGSRLRITGQGMPSPSGGPPGDLFLMIEVEPHPHFRREGDDLHLDLPITFGEAYFGAKVRVPTLEGGVMLKVPPGTQSGAKVRVGGKGIARKGHPPGNLIVHFAVQVPKAQNPELDAAAKIIADAQAGDPREGIAL